MREHLIELVEHPGPLPRPLLLELMSSAVHSLLRDRDADLLLQVAERRDLPASAVIQVLPHLPNAPVADLMIQSLRSLPLTNDDVLALANMPMPQHQAMAVTAALNQEHVDHLMQDDTLAGAALVAASSHHLWALAAARRLTAALRAQDSDKHRDKVITGLLRLVRTAESTGRGPYRDGTAAIILAVEDPAVLTELIDTAAWLPQVRTHFLTHLEHSVHPSVAYYRSVWQAEEQASSTGTEGEIASALSALPSDTHWEALVALLDTLDGDSTREILITATAALAPATPTISS